MQNHHIYSMLLFTVVELIFFTLSALKIIKFFVRFCAVLEIVFSSIYLLFFLSECVHRVIHISRSGYKKPLSWGMCYRIAHNGTTTAGQSLFRIVRISKILPFVYTNSSQIVVKIRRLTTRIFLIRSNVIMCKMS